MTESESKPAVYEACRIVLRPFISMVLRCGMTWKQFADLAKAEFVRVASAEFGIGGRPTNISRVSILTGISRKEVKRQRDLLATDRTLSADKTSAATRVLSAWYQDAEYIDDEGQPRLLAGSGPAPSFESLCRSYAGDVASQTMLKELLKTRSVEKTGSGKFRVLRRYYQPALEDEENLRFAVDRIRDVFETMNNNVFVNDATVLRFGGYADNEFIPVDAIPEFRDYLDKRGQAFLEEIDDWLAKRADTANVSGAELKRVGISLFATERENIQE
ncbi:MAG: hypothetical protein KJO82_11200 [Gammaproteobacteria bacterium]|nr:hypothetical protein [Gammaproteobacteria bacterium]